MILEEPSTPNEPQPFIHLKKFYKLCINKKKIEKDGLENVRNLFNKLGGWPVLEGANWNENEFEWKDTTYKFRRLGLPTDTIINVFVGEDVLNTSQRTLDVNMHLFNLLTITYIVLQVDQTSLGLDREYLIQGLNNEVVKAYYEYLVDLAVMFGADRSTAEIEMKGALDFEIVLAEVSLSL